MALPRIGFNEGSLLRRTLLHVATFVLGSAAFIGIVSVVLVSIARGFVAPHGADAADDPTLALASARAPGALGAPGAPGAPPRGAPRFGSKRLQTTVPAAVPSKDD